MATSRLYLGDHWLTDVMASIVLSWGVVASVALLDIWAHLAVLAEEPGGSATCWSMLPG